MPQICPGVPAPKPSLWVFAYGSLMWNPGFAHRQCVRATLVGWHRALCIYSHVHRGTPAVPGLVLGLDTGGSCEGLAYAIAPADEAATRAYLRQRELVTGVYREVTLPLQLANGQQVDATAFVVDPSHDQYAGRLTKPDLLRLVLQGVGLSGANPDYIRATCLHLRDLAIHDEVLEWLTGELDRLGH